MEIHGEFIQVATTINWSKMKLKILKEMARGVKTAYIKNIFQISGTLFKSSSVQNTNRVTFQCFKMKTLNCSTMRE